MNEFKKTLFEIKQVLFPFIQRPIEEIKRLPDWNWQTLIIAQLLLTTFCGILGGLLHLSYTSVLFGFFLVPLLTLVTVSVSSLFFFYTFQIFAEKLVEYRKIFTAVFFANIPFFIFQTLSGIFPPVSLIGLAFTSLLLIVGFVENFQIPRKFIIRLISALYILFALVSIISYLQSNTQMGKYQNRDGLDKIPEVQLGK